MVAIWFILPYIIFIIFKKTCVIPALIIIIQSTHIYYVPSYSNPTPLLHSFFYVLFPVPFFGFLSHSWSYYNTDFHRQFHLYTMKIICVYEKGNWSNRLKLCTTTSGPKKMYCHHSWYDKMTVYFFYVLNKK